MVLDLYVESKLNYFKFLNAEKSTVHWKLMSEP